MAAALLLDDAQGSFQADGDSRSSVVARRWCQRQLLPLVAADRDWRAQSEALARDLPLPERLRRARANAVVNRSSVAGRIVATATKHA